MVLNMQTNGLQHLPTTPSTNFIHRMETLFNAYLNPNSYHERELGITNDPDKIASYLSSGGVPELDESLILSCNADKGDYWYYPPTPYEHPELN